MDTYQPHAIIAAIVLIGFAVGMVVWPFLRLRDLVLRWIDSADETGASLKVHEQKVAHWAALMARVGGFAFAVQLWVALGLTALALVIWATHRIFEALLWLLVATAAVSCVLGFLGLMGNKLIGAVALKPLRFAILACVTRLDSRPPVVLLRSFIQATLWYRGTWEYRGRYDMRRFEEFLLAPLATAASASGPVLSIGEEPVRLFKAGHHVVLSMTSAQVALRSIDMLFIRSTDDNWRAVAELAIQASRFVLVLPATTAGLLEELALLNARSLTGKAIVAMPPPTNDEYFSWRDEASIRSLWNAVRDACSEHGWAFPAYTPEGLMYVPRPDFSILTSASLHGSADVKALTAAIEALLPHIPDAGTCPTAELIRRIEGITGQRALDRSRTSSNAAEPEGNYAYGVEPGYARADGTVMAVETWTSAAGRPYASIQVHFETSDGAIHKTWCPWQGNAAYRAGEHVRVRYRIADPLITQIVATQKPFKSAFLAFSTVMIIGMLSRILLLDDVPWYLFYLGLAVLALVSCAPVIQELREASRSGGHRAS